MLSRSYTHARTNAPPRRQSAAPSSPKAALQTAHTPISHRRFNPNIEHLSPSARMNLIKGQCSAAQHFHACQHHTGLKCCCTSSPTNLNKLIAVAAQQEVTTQRT
jgi:hypothetical protein